MSVEIVAVFNDLCQYISPMDIFITCHVFLSLLTFTIVGIAALQAFFLAIQERILRHKQTQLRRYLPRFIPSLITLENLLFKTIFLGFFLLTLLIISSIYFFHNIFTSTLILTSVLTLGSWLVFAVLLSGRYFAGWRGRIAINGTVFGFVFLLLAYFGTKILLLHS
jgi:ABC-type uncharacterized transport system permease subunit